MTDTSKVEVLTEEEIEQIIANTKAICNICSTARSKAYCLLCYTHRAIRALEELRADRARIAELERERDIARRALGLESTDKDGFLSARLQFCFSGCANRDEVGYFVCLGCIQALAYALAESEIEEAKDGGKCPKCGLQSWPKGKVTKEQAKAARGQICFATDDWECLHRQVTRLEAENARLQEALEYARSGMWMYPALGQHIAHIDGVMNDVKKPKNIDTSEGHVDGVDAREDDRVNGK